MKIFIEDLNFQCIIGILDFERKQEQDVIINLEIEYTYDKNEFINYADVAELIKKTMKQEKYLLIEDALLNLSQILKENFSKINTLNLKITKSSILPDCRVSVEELTSFDS
ncbi:dihydroneopterin aldolase [Sulfurimonas paralvinellae]|uniref:Dihydroneopterin aldolase n=1 Tax=Sulfurimonas paralvinellae TaxID=317658 RepID=A0A7M1B6B6_9BACT|nr:dihydroneopterin aldolase [Sulfurimonas paralvinellae]QOP45264.1 dihydroneopterin aldolase [Sulfurimonas paralvinellae]